MHRIKIYILLLVVLSGCTLPTFYQRFYTFNQSVSDGNLEAAEKMIKENEKKLEKGKLEFLFYVNAGTVLSMQGKFKESNEYFEKADLFVEDFKKKALEEGAALLLNPNLSTYRGEDQEILMINYYKALNYLQMGDTENALVEARRMNLRLQQLSEKYKSERKYQKDAFIHLLMGIVYDAGGEFNNAFIAYRNALEIYEKEFLDMFQLGVPDQLKYDLIRTAHLSGLYSERDSYKNKFGLNYTSPTDEKGNLVMLWNNGLGPIKDEWGINFAIIYGSGGWVTFVNKDFGMSFPFYIGNSSLNGLTWIKVVFPKYVERPELFTSARMLYKEQAYSFNRVEDLNAISFKVLEERMMLEFGKSLLRVALKQVAAAQVGKENEGLGVALSLLGSASESADTRNWQTLPHSIYYTRISLSPGEHELKMHLKAVGGEIVEHIIDVDINKGQTLVYPINTMATTLKIKPMMPSYTK
ncbi:MAG: hypothetical protein DRI71_09570 [Bacteroidetes bacterium]|nr:MAG: hypothetical protein DRI71_09570 [Bacteroidota bacterium]